MSRKALYSWLVIGIVILILAGASFFTLENISFTPGRKSVDKSTHVTPTRFAGTPYVLPTPTPSVPPTPAAPYLLQLSSDLYTNSTSQHKTEVEPASYAYGSTIVAAFQSGRFSNVGSSNIGWATSTDVGISWQ